jgi:hypothetical protein
MRFLRALFVDRAERHAAWRRLADQLRASLRARGWFRRRR